MKVQIRNLGVIKEAEIDLKPLTVLIGPNNAGKTWLAYTLSGVLGPFGWGKYTEAYVDEKIQEPYARLETAIQQVLDEGNARIDLVQFAEEYGESYLNNMARYAPKWMQEFLSTSLASFEDLKICLKLEETKRNFLEQVLKLSVNRKLSVGSKKSQPLLNALKEESMLRCSAWWS